MLVHASNTYSTFPPSEQEGLGYVTLLSYSTFEKLLKPTGLCTCLLSLALFM